MLISGAILNTVAMLFVTVQPALATSLATRGLHADMEQELAKQKLAGMVWATVTTDGIGMTGAVGLKNVQTGEPMTSDSRVHVGSVAKAVLAAGVLRLVTENRLALDTPVSELLTNMSFLNSWETSDPVRVRHLLTHTAGLDNARFGQVFSLEARPDAPLVDVFADDPELLRVRTRPGSRHSYSNIGYTLLGMAIESVTGERYERYLDDQLLRPLSMHDSTFSFVSQTGTYANARLAMGHFEDGVTQAAVPIYLRPAGQFTTTAADMAAFASFLMNEGRVDGKTFIDPALLSVLGHPTHTEAALAGLPAGHGLALARRDRHGVVGLCHPGSTVGYWARLCIYPNERKAYFVAMNTDSETANYEHFDALLIQAIGIDAASPTLPGVPSEKIEEWQGIYAPAPNGFSTFAGLDMALNFVRLRWDGTHLRLKPFQSDERLLVPAGGLLFRATDRTTASHVLLTSSDNVPVLSDGLRSYEKTPLLKIIPLWVSLIAGLSGVAYILLFGLWRSLAGRLALSSTLFLPFLALVALLLPLPFFLRQSFLQLGDVTIASALLAAVSAALPFAMLIAIALHFRRRITGMSGTMDVLAISAALQWMIVLMVWNLLPLRLWSL